MKEKHDWSEGWRKLVNPFFWDHPTPVNLLLILCYSTLIALAVTWIVWFLVRVLPLLLPTF